MNLIGQPIKHKIFGSGIVTDLSEGVVTICFQNYEKRFIYPDAFHSFLILKDQNAQKHIEEQIKKREIAAFEANQTEAAAQDQKNKLLNFKIAVNSHAVFDIPPEQINQIIKRGQISTGTYLSGPSKGMPRIAERIKPNSMCLLTSRPSKGSEQGRTILGAFMVREDFFGADANDGIIQGHPHHRILFPKKNQALFWEYFSQSAPPRWGNTAFKYCSEAVVNKILAHLAEQSMSPEEKETAVDFYRYFCKVNRLRPLIKLEEEKGEETS